MKHHLLALLLMAPLAIAAQTNGSAGDNDLLNASINERLDKGLYQQIRELESDTAAQNARIDQLQTTIDNQKEQLKLLDRIDDEVYRQCLLYPLERRFDPKLIDEALHSLNRMNIADSHREQYDTYAPLLNEYAHLNQEVITFLNDQKRSLTMKGGSFSNEGIAAAKQKFANNPYKRYYEKRNEKPWRSILYLDQALEDFFRLLDNKQLTSDALNELIERLQPKQTD